MYLYLYSIFCMRVTNLNGWMSECELLPVYFAGPRQNGLSYTLGPPCTKIQNTKKTVQKYKKFILPALAKTAFPPLCVVGPPMYKIQQQQKQYRSTKKFFLPGLAKTAFPLLCARHVDFGPPNVQNYKMHKKSEKCKNMVFPPLCDMLCGHTLYWALGPLGVYSTVRWPCGGGPLISCTLLNFPTHLPKF